MNTIADNTFELPPIPGLETLLDFVQGEPKVGGDGWIYEHIYAKAKRGQSAKTYFFRWRWPDPAKGETNIVAETLPVPFNPALRGSFLEGQGKLWWVGWDETTDPGKTASRKRRVLLQVPRWTPPRWDRDVDQGA